MRSEKHVIIMVEKHGKNMNNKRGILKMKKCLSILLAILMVFTVSSMPTRAADTDVQTILKQVKKVFSIDDTNMKFTYDTVDGEEGINGYNFEWVDQKEGGYINVQTDENGRIICYDNSLNQEDENDNQVPKLSKKEALSIAYAKVETIFPEAINQISKDFAKVESGYRVTFDRVINGIVVKDNSIGITIDSKTGKITYYTAEEWTTNIENVTNQNIIDKKNITNYFEKNMPLTLQYVSAYNNDSKKYDIKLVYGVDANDYDYYIHAQTGEKTYIKTPIRYYTTAGKGSSNVAEDSASTLSPAEISEINTHKEFMTKDKAISLLKGISALDFNKDLNVKSYSITSYASMYSNQTNYSMNLNLEAENQYCSAAFNPQTGKLIYFSSNNFYLDNANEDDNKKPNISYETAKQTAETFLNTYAKENITQTKLVEANKWQIGDGDYSFTYQRMVNGIAFADNQLVVSVDSETGKITFFSNNWDEDIHFEKPDNIIDISKATANELSYFNQNCEYIPVVKNDDGYLEKVDIYRSYPEKITLVPVYSYVNDAYVDAKTGKVVNQGMDTYEKEDTYLNLESLYPQLEGHYCKEIALKLFDMDIMLANENFKPDDTISKSEFEELANHLSDRMYNLEMVNKTDSSTLTRMEAIKIIINNLGYEKVAQKSSIFNCTFSDKAAIGQANYGYAAIAKGLGICVGSNNQFMPNKTLTYADALIMIYQALSV